jgi:hypothetical protein
MGKFESALDLDIEGIETLPLLHTCDARTFVKVIEDLKLKIRLCDVFKKDLLYTFYGTPSYKLKMTGSTGDQSHFMVCFILDTTKVKDFYKIYPFDSGAFEKLNAVKQIYFHKDTSIEDFALKNCLSSPKRVIKTFYNNNKNYISKKPQRITFPASNYDANQYNVLINDETTGEIDERTSSIEVIFNTDISLSEGIVKQIIIPNNFKDDKILMDLIKRELNISEPIGYETVRGNPNEYFGLIRHLYLEFLKL